MLLQAHFAETTYYKSMLESKNRVMSKIARAGSRHANVKPLQDTMDDLNRRFQVRVVRHSRSFAVEDKNLKNPRGK